MSKEDAVKEALDNLCSEAHYNGNTLTLVKSWRDTVESAIAANKAAEGGLPERISQLIFDNTSLGWDKASDLATAVLVFVDADRAAHPVGNNAEVDLPDYKIYAVINSMGWSLEDSAKDELFSLCKQVLRKVANKAEVEAQLEEIAQSYDGVYESQGLEIGPDLRELFKDVFSQATPPATTGRKVANKAEVEPVCVCGSPTTLGSVHRADGPCYVAEATPPATTGASTVLTDERTSINSKEFQKILDDFYGTASVQGSTKQEERDLIAHINQHVAREVAAQAGQVAVLSEDEIEWSHGVQERLRSAVLGDGEDEGDRQVMAEAACLLAALTGRAPSPAKESK